MTERKFYKKVVQVEILSEDPIGCVSLEQIAYGITEGDWSGKLETVSDTELNGKEAVKELLNQGSDCTFFQLDEDGNDVD